MADFEPCFQEVIHDEGGFKLTNIKGDAGGLTYAGISRRFHPEWPGWELVDKGEQPPTELVRQLYRKKFWDIALLDRMPQSIANDIFNFGVNADPRVSVKLAQTVVGVSPDGVVGPKTIEALSKVDPEIFKAYFCLAKIARYRDIVRKNPKQIKFLMGWINRSLEKLS